MSTIDSGQVIWITGLSESGKTTLAKLLSDKFTALDHKHVLLDGDQLRMVFGKTQAYDREARLKLARTTTRLCKMLAEQGHTVVIAIIALFKEIHQWNRQNIPNYSEIYLNVPLAELKRRDSKGLYKDFAEGRASNVYGLDLPYDPPERPDLQLDYQPGVTPEEELRMVLDCLARQSFLSPSLLPAGRSVERSS